MKILPIAVVAALVASTVALPSAASAQDRHADAPHKVWNNHHRRQVCNWTSRHHHRVRVCDWR